MSKETTVDKDLVVKTDFDTSNIDFYKPTDEPFTLYGINPPDEKNR